MTSFTEETSLVRPDWMADAACRTSDPELFFPIRTDDTAAIAVCRRCPVQSDCLIYALRTNQKNGIWGGKTEHQRAALRTSIRRRAACRPRHRAGTRDTASRATPRSSQAT